MKFLVPVVAIGLASAACSETTIDRSVCGNGIVEPGEDCDSTDPRCSECGITCTSTADCSTYDASGGTAGFVCGADGFCHAPSGTFQAAGQVAIPTTAYRVTDTDGDGIGDVVVQSQTAVTVVFGDADATLATTATVQTPFPQGAVSFADIDGDTHLDVLAPTADGIVAYTTPLGQPTPFPFPDFVPAGMGKPLFVQPLPTTAFETHLGIVGTADAGGALSYLILDANQIPPANLAGVSLCNGVDTEFDPDNVDTFVIGQGQEIVVAALQPPGGAERLCILEVTRTGQTSYTVTPISLAPTAALQSRGVLVDLHGLQCPSLVVAQGAPFNTTVVEYKPASASPPCSFTSPTPLLNVPENATPVGSVPLAPPLPNFGATAIVLTTGIYGYAPASGALAELYRSDRLLDTVRAAPMQGDPNTADVVASSKGLDDLDILLRRGPTFLRFRFDTDSPIVSFLIGDFDGNQKPDIAYVERGSTGELLQIAYGTSDQLLPGVTVGTFENVRSVVAGNILDSTDRTGIVSDLAILFDTGPATELTLLHGSPQRTMLAFFDPRPHPTSPDSLFRGVVAGNFTNGAAAHNDVLAIEQSTPVNLYVSQGATNGELHMGDGPSTSQLLVDCSGPATDPSFCLDFAQYVAWPIDAMHDVVIGVDGTHSMIILDPRQMQPNQEAPIQRFTGKLIAPDRTIPRALQPITLDDGTQRLLVQFSAGPNEVVTRDAAAVNLCTIDPVAGPSCVDLGATVGAAIGVPDTVCVDAGFAHIAAAHRFSPPDHDTADLVVLCRDPVAGNTVYAVSIDGTSVVPLLSIGRADAMQVGDVTGDGIADLVFLDRGFAVPIMRVFRQCNSREPDCGIVTAGDMPMGGP